MDKKDKSPQLSGRKSADNLGLLGHDEIKPFDKVDGGIDGQYSKCFVRYDLDSLEELKNELRNNPNCSYKTAYNDAIIEGFAPKYIPVLVKRITGSVLEDTKTEQEVLSSRLLNLWGQPTAYNFIIQKGCEDYLGSVDFISLGQQFCNCREFGFGGLQTMAGIRAQRIQLRDYFKNELNRTDEDVDNEIEELLSDFLIAKVVREQLLCDLDMDNIANFGALVDLNQRKVFMAPHFDLEYSYMLNGYKEEAYNRITMYASNVPAFKEKFVRLMGFLERSVTIDEATGKTPIEMVVDSANTTDWSLKNKVKRLSASKATEMLNFAKENELYREEKGM